MADAATAETINERQRRILERVSLHGFATIEILAKDFDVSAQTIRRDIILLDSLQLLQRFHGGAGLPGEALQKQTEQDADQTEGVVRLGYVQKRRIATEAKARIGAATARLIPDAASLFLDVGTTVEAVAEALRQRHGLRVFTNSLPTASLLAAHNGNEVFVCGGSVRGADGSLVGDAALQAVRRVRPDFLVLGFSGLDDDGALMDFDIDKAAVKAAMLANARQCIAVGDSSKFQRHSLLRIAEVGQFDTCVSDALPGAAVAEAWRRAGIRMIVA